MVKVGLELVKPAPGVVHRDSRSQRREKFWGFGLVSLWLIGFLLFGVVPLAAAVFISFTNWSPVSGPFWNAHVVGVDNYRQMLFHDPRFWHSIRNSVIYALGSVAITNLVALPMAWYSISVSAVCRSFARFSICRPSCPPLRAR